MRYHARMASRSLALARPGAVRYTRTALLALALLIVLAQVVALRHAYSHTPAEATTQSGGKHPGGLTHCGTCIVAAAIGGAAPPAATPLTVRVALQPPVVFAAVAPCREPLMRPYAIRAPPIPAS